MIRSIETLRREQAAILVGYRESKAVHESVAVLPRPGNMAACVVYGRVSGVVITDPTNGPHLHVVRQAWSGVPPVAADAADGDMLCYPTPNRVVSDYGVGDYVRIVAAHGAMVAEPID